MAVLMMLQKWQISGQTGQRSIFTNKLRTMFFFQIYVYSLNCDNQSLLIIQNKGSIQQLKPPDLACINTRLEFYRKKF